MEKRVIPQDEFHLAITMAGAASAGCYTGGAMDYLFELLDQWDKARSGNLAEYKDVQHLVPTHKVIIDAMGGTSAGGMTSTMAAIYALNGEINPVREPGIAKEYKNNLLYDSWVVMDDLDPNDKRETFEKLFDTEDLEDGTLKSILNSKFIDHIAEKSFAFKKDIKTQVQQLPSYISKDLQLLLSHCLLRGIPLSVNFETPISKTGHKSIIPNHTTYEHFFVSQYHLNHGQATNVGQYLWLNPYDKEASKNLKLSTKATGAFPVGLLYREFSIGNFDDNYIKTVLKRIATGNFGSDDPDPEKRLDLEFLPQNFTSITVDGGAINNEPYREVMSLLREKYVLQEDGAPQFGVVMIDPFPDQAQFPKEYKAPIDLLEVAPAIIGALTDQSRVKRREMLELEDKHNFRSIIFPRKWKYHISKTTGKEFPKAEENPIACGSAMAFSGLLDIGFRQHDFFLGRNNAKNFFHYFFSFPYDEDRDVIHPIHRSWTKEMRLAFVFKKPKDSQEYLPIVPDIRILLGTVILDEQSHYNYTIPDIPPYDAKRLFALKPVIANRFSKIIDTLKNRKSEPLQSMTLTKEWISQYEKKTIWKRLKNTIMQWILKLVYAAGRKPAASILTDKVIQKILEDLERTDSLQASTKFNSKEYGIIKTGG